MKKRSKYNAVKTIVDGITFDSKKEANRYLELKLMEQSGEIRDLELQVPYSIDVEGYHICKYTADFQYWDNNEKKVITEDCKGFRTPSYRLKKKLLKAVHGVEIYET